MKALELWILGYLLNSLWQAPLVLLAAWVAAQMARTIGPRSEHRVWVGALVATAVLPMCSFHWSRLWQEALAFLGSWRSGTGTAGTRVTFGPGTVSGDGVLRLSPELLAGIAAIYGCTMLYFLGRLAWGLWKTHALCRSAVPLAPMSAEKIHHCGRAFGIDAVQVAVSPAIPGPMTVGIQRKILLLPSAFVENVAENDLDTVLAHESAHMRRGDFAKNLFYRLFSLPVAYHPAMWMTCSRLAGTREMVCDAMAAESAIGRESYARSLLRLAAMLSDRKPALSLHAIGIFDANIFERRVMSLTQKHAEVRGARRLVIAIACGVVALVTCASALALRMNVSEPAAQSQPTMAPKKITKKIMVSPGVMAGNKISGSVPVYPEEAKKAKISGTVVLYLTIDKEGVPTDIRVKESPSPMLDTSAVDAVRDWRWKPYLLNGDPVEVETEVNVTYSLKP
jgi:TonB family protein